MRALLVSDLHSNAAAVRAVLSRVRRKKFDRVICLGDFVGYAAEPNQVIDMMRAVRGPKLYIRGNHDRVAAGFDEGPAFNPIAREAAIWSRAHLSARNRRFLRDLTVGPVLIANVMLCHGSPTDEDEYVFSEHHAAQILVMFDAPVILYGHTHVPVVFSIDSKRNVAGEIVSEEVTIRLDPDKRYLINPGSVGQPRDRNPAAACAIFDSDRMTVQFIRVPYDFEKTQRAIERAGLPAALGERLAVGA